MKRKKVLWLLCMAALCLVLYTIVISRMDRKTDVIFGGVDGAYVSSDSVSFQDPNAVATPEPTEDIWPDIDINLSQYTIVNEDNLLSSAWVPEVEKISTTRYMYFDKAALPYLEAMIADLNEAGFSVFVNAAYREYSEQNRIFNGRASSIAGTMGVTDYLDPNYQKAVDEAKKSVAIAGSSEHQLGLAVDLHDRQYGHSDYSQMNQDFYAWLDEHCAEYGFIKRYPTRKLLLTGWDEPWHYRYVGVEVATFIMENELCYEEFYQHYSPGFEF